MAPRDDMKLGDLLKVNGYTDEDLESLPEWVRESQSR